MKHLSRLDGETNANMLGSWDIILSNDQKVSNASRTIPMDQSPKCIRHNVGVVLQQVALAMRSV